MSDKNHILLWSGGFDSTAILLSILSNPEQFQNVRIIGCGLKNTFNYEQDKTARQKIAEILKKSHSNFSYVEQELDLNCLCSTQMPVWACLSAINVSPLDTDTTMLYGYIRGDDFWHYRHEFETAVKAVVASYSSTKLTFGYPLEWKYKKELVSWYIHYPEVFNSISWGGDTEIVKAKEREELQFLFDALLKAKKEGAKPIEPKKEEICAKLSEPADSGQMTLHMD